MDQAGINNEQIIFGMTEGVRADSPQLSTRFDLEKITETPVVERKIMSLVLLNTHSAFIVHTSSFLL